MNIQTALEQTGGTGKYLIGGCGGKNNQVNVLGVLASGLDRPARCVLCKITSRLTLCGNVAFDDAGTFTDPLISSINHLLQIEIGELSLR